MKILKNALLLFAELSNPPRETGKNFAFLDLISSETICCVKELVPNFHKYAVCKKGTWTTDENDPDCLNLFKWGDGIDYSVKNSTLFSFMTNPCESTWSHPHMINRAREENKAHFYSFSFGKRQFELYVLYQNGKLPFWLLEAKKDIEGESKFTSYVDNLFIAGSFANVTTLLRELKPGGQITHPPLSLGVQVLL